MHNKKKLAGGVISMQNNLYSAMYVIIAVLLVFSNTNLFASIRLSRSPVWENTSISNPCGAGFADFDGDGWPDLAITRGVDAASLSNYIFYSNEGELSSSPGWESTDIYASGQLYIGDFDRNLQPDLLVSNLGVTDDQIPQSLYLNYDGLSTSPSWESPATRSFACTAGDPDGDGDLDAIFSRGYWVTSDEQTTVIYENNNGAFNSTVLWESDDAYYGVGIAMDDVDIDGDLDMVVGSRGSGVRIYNNNNGSLETTPIWQSNPFYGSRMMALGDVDGDGYRDLATAIPGSSGTCALFMNIGGTFDATPTWSVGLGSEPSCVAWGDVDGDGDLDLATGSWFVTARIYENVDGVLSSTPAWTCPADVGNIQKIAWGDYDKDNLVDTYETFYGDGSRKLFYLNKMPVHSISSIEVDGTPVSTDLYCYDNSQGWISLASAPASGSMLTVYYTYSNDLDLVITGLNGVFLFANRSIANPDEIKILLLQDQRQGTTIDGNDAKDNMLTQFDDFGWVISTAGLTESLSRCTYALSNGALPMTTDMLVSDITDVTEYDIICLTPSGNGLENLMNDPATLQLLNDAANAGKVVAAWCRAVRVLAAADLINGLNVVGHLDYQSEYEAAGATFIGNDNPPIIQGNIVTGVRSLYYRDEMCDAMARAVPPKIVETRSLQLTPTQMDSLTILSFISDFAQLDTAMLVVDTGTGFFEISMYDDGLHHDDLAGDSLYGATLPLISDGTEVTYYIRAVEDTIHTTVLDPPDAPVSTYSITIGYRIPSVIISEFMAAENNCCADNFGDFDDWIEIYNPEAIDVDLTGTYLTNDLAATTKFELNNIIVPSGGYVVLWADNEISEGDNHVSFVLAGGGGDVGLFDADRHGNMAMSTYSYGLQRNNYSYGRLSDVSNTWLFFHTPTPGSTNGAYLCGDATNDYNTNILDIVFMINDLYKSGPSPDPLEKADVNSDGLVNILDIVRMINFIYKAGPVPSCPQ